MAVAQRALADAIHGSPYVVAQQQRVQGMFGHMAASNRERSSAPRNDTTLPNRLKSGIESLSGMSLDGVSVHFNSSAPAQLHSHAYAQGTDIHVAPGQERHLPHEAWHVVQQAQGRVAPTWQMKEGTPVNDDAGLEREADAMGARAVAIGAGGGSAPDPPDAVNPDALVSQRRVVQRAGVAVVQKFDSELVLQLVNTIGALAAAELFRRWPVGRSIPEVLQLVYQAGLVAGVKFANFTAWDSPTVIALATGYGANRNGLTADEWITVAGQAGINQPATTIAFCQTAQWSIAGILPLLGAFQLAPGGLSAAQWTAVAARAGNDQVAAATAFAQLANWTWAGIDPLTTAFQNNRNNLGAADWITIAGRVAHDAAADASVFAQLANWTWAGIGPLTAAFAVPHGLTAGQWALVAGRVAADAHADAISFARLANWTWAGIDPLTTAFQNNRNNLAAADWIAVAGRVANDADVDAASFAQLANWTWAGIDPLTASFAVPNARTAAEWVLVAGRVAADAHADAIGFARLANWTWAGIDPLTTAFQVNPNNLTAARWIALAGLLANDADGDVAAFAQLANWTWAGIRPLTAAFAHAPHGLSSARWVLIAGRVDADVHADAIGFAQLANWTWAGIDPLTAAFFANQNNVSAAHWITIAGRVANNAAADAAMFAQLATWTWGGIDPLTLAFAGQPFGLNAAAWVAIAGHADSDDHAGVTNLLQAIQVNNPGAALAPITNFLVAAEYGDLAEMAALLQTVANTGTLIDVTALMTAANNQGFGPGEMNLLIQAIHVNHPATAVPLVTALVVCALDNGDLNELTAVVTTVAANGTVTETTTLLTGIEGHQAGTALTDTDALLTAIEVHNAGTTLVDSTALINAVAANGTVPETTALVNSVAAVSTLAELTTLVLSIENHNAGTAVTDTDALVQTLGGVGNVCTELDAIVNAVAANGTVPEMTTMMTQAVVTIGAANVAALVPFITRDNVHNTPPNVEAFLLALNPNTHARFLLVEPRIPWFQRLVAAPNHGMAHHGAFSCNAWQFFYHRHSYEYFVFAMAAGLNSMWAPGVNALNEFNASIGPAIANGLVAAGGYNQQNGGNNQVGTVGAGGAINHLMPIGGNVDIILFQAETNAIEPLR